jgi:ligand-binding sensor domain-containing protein
MFSALKNRIIYHLRGCVRLFCLTLFFCGLQIKTNLLFAQIGTWRTHFNYLNTTGLAQVGAKIYCFSEEGFFLYDTAEKQTTIFSKSDGLAESGISKIGYDASSQTLVVAYASGNIDLLKMNSKGFPDKIINLPLLKLTPNINENDKVINDISFAENRAYLSTNFGILEIDFQKNEIVETNQNLGKNGNQVIVNQIVIQKKSIFISTSEGIKLAQISPNINLKFYGNWEAITDENLALSTINDQVFGFDLKGQIFVLENKKFKLLGNYSKGFNKIFVGNGANSLVISGQTLVSVNPVNQEIKEIANFQKNKITDAIIANGKVWITDFGKGLMAYESGSFVNYKPFRTDTLYQNRKDKIVLDLDKNQWQIADFGGILVKNSKGQSKVLSTSKGNGALPNTDVQTLSLDRDGSIWVGTATGVCVFENPPGVFKNANFDAYTPIFDRKKLLSKETITSIAVDAGNRKWMGTTNGLYLFNADGTELVNYFEEKSSPLPSNKITYIEVEPKSGEVFIRTEKGMVSYMGTANEAPDSQIDSEVKVFPNPVRPDYNGTIGISGLTENAFIKITDIAGRLVYETRANGGLATWDGRTLNGNRSETGIYLIFSNNAKGEETLVSKLAIVK